MNKENNNINNEYLSRIISADEVVSVERVSFYGLRVCLVTYNEEPPYNKIYYFEESVRPLYEKHGITDLNDIPALHLPAVEGRREILETGVAVGVPEDKIWRDSIEEKLNQQWQEDPDGTQIDEKLQDLSTLLYPFDWTERVFTDKSGRKGLKDCWGNVIIPAMFEECKMGNDIIKPVRQNGKWGLVASIVPYNTVVDFAYDYISYGSLGSDLGFLTERNGQCGIFDESGKEIIPIEMDDVSYTSTNGITITKQNGMYGFRFADGTYITPCVKDIDIPDADNEPVRFLVADEWRYLGDDGQFTDAVNGHSLRKQHISLKSCFSGKKLGRFDTGRHKYETIHVINKNGERKEMTWKELQKSQDDHFDVDWYLSHGYVTLEEHEQRMRQKLREHEKQQ